MTSITLTTGGAGFLGLSLISKLASTGGEVRSLDIAEPGQSSVERVDYVIGDIRDTELLKKMCDGVTTLVHTAAALPRNKAREIWSVDVEGTRSVFEAAKKAGVKQVIHISSTAVYGVPDHHPLYETDELIGVGPYGKAKIEAEKIAESYRDSMSVTILRPKSFIGPERLGVFALLYDWAYSGHNFPIPGRGDNLYQYLDVEDLVDLIIHCINNPGKSNDSFNVGAKEFSTFKADFQAVLDRAGHGKRVVSIPAMPAIWALRLLDKVKLSPLYPWVYETAVKDSFVSIEKAEKVLSFTPKYSNADALVRNYDWYVQNLDSFKGQSGVTHRVPWSQGALTIAKKFF
jgi:nucleoside-diphosphate-sugar epimerase